MILLREELLDGKTRKEIGRHLEISAHTVGDYVKAVYGFFGVNSHSELIHRFMGKQLGGRGADA